MSDEQRVVSARLVIEAPAEAIWELIADPAPVEPAKIVCVRSHWFLLPVAHLERRDVSVVELARDHGV